jgi:hypothetical protein
MIVTSLSEAERIVEESPHLSWDGWDIQYLVQDDYAEFLHIGFFDQTTQKWYKRFIFACEPDGWNIPDSVLS